MKISIEKKHRSGKPADLSVLFVPATELKKKRSTSGGIRALVQQIGPRYREVLKQFKFSGSHAQQVLIPSTSASNPLLMLIGLEIPKSDSTRERLERIRNLGAQIIRQATQLTCSRIEISLDHIWVGSEQPLEAFWEGLALSSYQYRRYKTAKRVAGTGLNDIALITSRTPGRSFAARMQAICDGVLFARDLINTPANDLRPSDLAKICQKSARQHGLSIELLNQKKLERMGANGILCVGMGSEDQSYLARITYTPRGVKPLKHVALVGKAITFDCGGLSIKTSMDTMKCDMSGGAAVLATMCALKTLKLPIKVSGFIPISENMINGKAMRPGDIFTLLNGKTVEVLNTDAEGRLILADALTLANRTNPDVIIDLATLTGACKAALGSKYSGLFCNNQQLVDALSEASDISGEPLWQLPLAREYHKLIFSEVADYKNLFKEAGAITAALFLEEFVNKIPWAHLDIAGPAFSGSNEGVIKTGGVGFGVRTLIRVLEGFAESAA